MANVKNQQTAQPVEETLTKSEAFFLKNQKAIIIAVIAIIVIIAGIILYRNYVTIPGEQRASTALAKSQELFSVEEFDRALNGDSLGNAGFLRIANEHGSTKAGNLAKLYAGLCYAKLGKWQAAADYLEKYDAADDQMVSPAALGALGNAYANLNQLDKAVETLKKAAEKADSYSLSPTFLIQAGQILESQNKKAEALKLYQTVKDKYFQSMQSQTIDQYIEHVKE